MGQATKGEEPRAERRVLPITGTVQYLEMQDARGIHISLHAPPGHPGEVYITGLDRKKDYRPLRLDSAGLRMLRDGIELALEDLESTRRKGG